jgi:hypothetical protein
MDLEKSSEPDDLSSSSKISNNRSTPLGPKIQTLKNLFSFPPHRASIYPPRPKKRRIWPPRRSETPSWRPAEKNLTLTKNAPNGVIERESSAKLRRTERGRSEGGRGKRERERVSFLHLRRRQGDLEKFFEFF